MVTGDLLLLGHSFFAHMATFGVMVTERILGMNFFPRNNEENSKTPATKSWGLTTVCLDSLILSALIHFSAFTLSQHI